ncbi:hypothetical protein AAER27_08610, partial [Pseudomonas aeruginosa]
SSPNPSLKALITATPGPGLSIAFNAVTAMVSLCLLALIVKDLGNGVIKKGIPIALEYWRISTDL